MNKLHIDEICDLIFFFARCIHSVEMAEPLLFECAFCSKSLVENERLPNKSQIVRFLFLSLSHSLWLQGRTPVLRSVSWLILMSTAVEYFWEYSRKSFTCRWKCIGFLISFSPRVATSKTGKVSFGTDCEWWFMLPYFWNTWPELTWMTWNAIFGYFIYFTLSLTDNKKTVTTTDKRHRKSKRRRRQKNHVKVFTLPFRGISFKSMLMPWRALNGSYYESFWQSVVGIFTVIWWYW